MKQAIAILETEIATRQAAIKDELQAIEDLEYIVMDLHRLSGTEPAPEPKLETAKQPAPEPEAPPVPEPIKEVIKETAPEAPPKQEVKNEAFTSDTDTFSTSRVSRNGENKIPSDKEVLEAMKTINDEATAGMITSLLNKSSDLPIKPHSVIVSLDRLVSKQMAFKTQTDRPFMWSLKPIESSFKETVENPLGSFPKKHGNKPKSKLVAAEKGYNEKFRFAESKGYKNVAEAIGAMGANTFNQEFKNSDFLGRL